MVRSKSISVRTCILGVIGLEGDFGGYGEVFFGGFRFF